MGTWGRGAAIIYASRVVDNVLCRTRVDKLLHEAVRAAVVADAGVSSERRTSPRELGSSRTVMSTCSGSRWFCDPCRRSDDTNRSRVLICRCHPWLRPYSGNLRRGDSSCCTCSKVRRRSCGAGPFGPALSYTAAHVDLACCTADTSSPHLAALQLAHFILSAASPTRAKKNITSDTIKRIIPMQQA